MFPPGVKVEYPLQAYFPNQQRKQWGSLNARSSSLMKVHSVHYVEGCTAPTFSSQSLHSAVVEIVCLKGSRVRYTTIQNWGKQCI